MKKTYLLAFAAVLLFGVAAHIPQARAQVGGILCHNGHGLLRESWDGGSYVDVCIDFDPGLVPPTGPAPAPGTVDLVVDGISQTFTSNRNLACPSGYTRVMWDGSNTGVLYCKHFATALYQPGTSSHTYVTDFKMVWPSSSNNCGAGWTEVAWDGTARIDYCQQFETINYTIGNNAITGIENVSFDFQTWQTLGNTGAKCPSGYSLLGISGHGTFQTSGDFVECTKSGTIKVALPGVYKLSLLKSGTGTGKLTTSPAGIDCGTNCSYSFNADTAVTITPTPDAGSVWGGWQPNGQQNDCSSDLYKQSSPYVLLMGHDWSCTGIFNKVGSANYQLTITKTGTGTGTVTDDKSKISCGSTCSASYANNTDVTLTATPAAGSIFTGWTGNCLAGTGNTALASMTKDRTCTANFDLSGGGNVSVACTYAPYSQMIAGTWVRGLEMDYLAKGAPASYKYSWSGRDGLSGSASSTRITYTTTGIKTARVSATNPSNSSMTGADTCSVTVKDFTCVGAIVSTTDMSAVVEFDSPLARPLTYISNPTATTKTYISQFKEYFKYSTPGTKTVTASQDGWPGSNPTNSASCTFDIPTGGSCPVGHGVTIKVISNVSTTWTITGPQSVTRLTPAASSTYTDWQKGTYTIIPGALAGYDAAVVTPASSQPALSCDTTITFNLFYQRSGGGNVSCSPQTQSANPNQSVTVNAAGTSPYTWAAPGGNPSSGTGGFFQTQYATGGNKTITVTDSTGGSNTCSVNVTVPADGLFLVPSERDINAGDHTTFDAMYDPDGANNGVAPIPVGGSSVWTSANPAIASFVPNGNLVGEYVGNSQGTTIVQATYLGLKATGTIVVGPFPPKNLTVDMTPFPDTGNSPLATDLVTNVGGMASGPITYSLWWNCNSGNSNPAVVASVCGTLPNPPGGSCASNINGFKCNTVNETTETTGHTYTNIGLNIAYVIAERGGYSAAGGAAVVVKPGTGPGTPLACSGSPSNFGANQSVTWTATGGLGNYSWTADAGATPLKGTGTTFVTKWSAPGTHGVQVSDGNNIAFCAGGLSLGFAPTCVGPATLNVNQDGTFYADYGDGTYSWTALSQGWGTAVPTNGSGPSFTTHFTAVGGGSKIVQVFSNHQSASCKVALVDVSDCTFGAAPTVVRSGASSTLSWTCTGSVTSCTVTSPAGTVTTGGANGAKLVYPTSTTPYTLTCNAGVSVKTATVTVLRRDEVPPGGQ